MFTYIPSGSHIPPQTHLLHISHARNLNSMLRGNVTVALHSIIKNFAIVALLSVINGL